MSATSSLRPIVRISCLGNDSIDIDWKISEATVFLGSDGRIQKRRCSRCNRSIGKMREQDRCVQDLPPGSINVYLRFTAYQGRCASCKHFETVTIPGLSPKAQATEQLKRHVSHLCRYMVAIIWSLYAQ